MKFLARFHVFIEILGLTFFQNASSQIIYEKWSGEKFPFKVATSYYDTSFKTEFGSSFSFPTAFYNKKEDVLKTNIEFGYGQIELYQISNLEKYKRFHRIAFNDNLNLVQVTFLKSVNFNLSKFNKGVSFLMSNFLDTSSFSYSEFFQNTSFIWATFSKQVNFSGATFHDETDFSNVVFTNGAVFSPLNAIYRGEIIIAKTNTYFGTDLENKTLKWTKFNKGVNFYNCKFLDHAYFSETQFLCSVSFNQAYFSGNLFFDNAIFAPKTTFVSTQLPEIIYFRNVNLDSVEQNINFSNSSIDSLRKKTKDPTARCQIFLAKTDVNKLILDANKFELVFDSTVAYDDVISTHQQVIKKCKDLGLEESIKGFDIDLQKIRIKHSYPKIGSFLIWINEYWWNFGYERTKVFRNIFLAFLVSFIVIFLFLPLFLKAYFPKQLNKADDNLLLIKWYSYKYLLTRLKVSFFYTALIFFALKIDNAEMKVRQHPFLSLVLYFMFVIGIIHLAYLASVVLIR